MDLQWRRIVWQKFALGLDNKSISFNLRIDPLTVHRVATQFNECGNETKIILSIVERQSLPNLQN